MNHQIYFLGKSSFAIAVLADTLKKLIELEALTVVANIPDEDNQSLVYEYRISGITYHEIMAKDFNPESGDQYVVASIGKSRKKIAEYFIKTFDLSRSQFIELIDPSVVMGNGVSYGCGLHISPLSVVAPFTSIGNFVIINRNASIGHHCVLEDYVTVNPGVTIAGCCHLGEGATIGAGAVVLDKIKIGKNSIIGAGSVVTRDVPEGVIAYGSPAKIIRENS